MQVFRGVPERATTSTVLTIGNFDGVHLGHRALLQELKAKARELALPATVLTFEPHPRELFVPDQAPARLASLRDKIELLAEAGVDRVHVCRFNAQAGMHSQQKSSSSASWCAALSVRHLIIGDDFRFGKARGKAISPCCNRRALSTTLARRSHAHRRLRKTTCVSLAQPCAMRLLQAISSVPCNCLGRAYVIAGRVMRR
jgi:riboflavin kinase/FMN adenylyltransferase